ncbi:MAG: hypothetical protein M0D55_06210 [Elusimicrobiota bacterium]|nr:MAG: hypothetical protein M0D55_06210 [Elusimicrobiota bacterium]
MPITPLPVSTRRIRVYELVNRTRMESLLVTTESDSSDLLRRLRAAPPIEAGFWRPEDDIDVATLALSVTEPTAVHLIESYLAQMQRRTWRFRVWRA